MPLKIGQIFNCEFWCTHSFEVINEYETLRGTVLFVLHLKFNTLSHKESLIKTMNVFKWRD